jgi:hypothetical protein
LISDFFVVLQIAVDQAGNIVRIAFFFLKEGLIGTIVFDFNVVVGDHDLVIDGIGLFEGDEFCALNLRRFIVIDGRSTRRSAAESRHLEDRAALRANDRILVQVKKFGAARLALALTAEFGFRHVDEPLKRVVFFAPATRNES